MRPRAHRGILSPVTMREIYHELGDFTVKMLIDPSLSQSIEGVEVDMRNSDGKSMAFTAKRWGTKLTISFRIDESTPDGVSIIDVTMRKRGQLIRERHDLWVVKP